MACMADENEIGEAGRRERFERWEKIGVAAIRQDLEATGGLRLVGGSALVRSLAWEWVRMKEAEATEEIARRLSPSQSVNDILNRRDPGMEHLLKSFSPEAAAALGASLTPAAAQPPSAAPPAPASTPEEKRTELLTLKPTIWGMGIDLKELGRRLRRRLMKKR
jgi:hypothetical protein